MQRIPVSSSRRSSRSPGFTLIELVIVMVILAALATVVIPKLVFLQAEATPVSGLASAQDLMNNLETYKVTTGFYPLRFDSLLTQAGTVIPNLYFAGSGTSATLVPAAFDTDGAAGGSWGMSFGPTSSQGMYTIMDQDATISDLNSSFNTPRQFTYGGDNVAAVSQATKTGAAIWQAAGFPSTTAFNYNQVTGATTGAYTAPASATGVTLVALGVGPQCSAVGKTMSSPPLQTGQIANGNYSRYVAIFAVYGSTSSTPMKPAELKLVLDSYGNTITSNVNLYQQAIPQDN
jgi:prepilin-type N-terminal cleavage/methylation domain-containing protein